MTTRYEIMEVNVDGAAYITEEHQIGRVPDPPRTWDNRDEAIAFADEQQAAADATGNAWGSCYKVFPDYGCYREDGPVYVTRSTVG
jgi:hypothetical protein